MKKYLWLFTLMIPAIAWAASTFTTHYHLEKPADGDTNWGLAYRSALNTIDTQMFTTASGLTDHITDPTDAHAATAISTTAGPTVCTVYTNVQGFLNCLDAQVAIATGVGGEIATTNTNQIISGQKSFTQQILGSAGISISSGSSIFGGPVTFGDTIMAGTFSTGLVHSSVAGLLSSSTLVNADVSASAAIAFSKLASLTSAHILVGSSGNVATDVAMTGDLAISNTGVTSYAGTVPATKGGTGLVSGTAGGILYFPTTTTIASSSAGSTTTVLHGSAGSNPTFSAVALTTDVSGILPIANGGTNSSATPTAGGVGYGTGTAHAYTAAGSSLQVLTSNAASAPTYQNPATFTYFTGYFAAASSWSTTSSSFGDGTNAGGNTLVTRVSNNISVAAAATNIAGITFTPAAATDIYDITAVVSVNCNSAGNDVGVSMTDGTAQIGVVTEQSNSTTDIVPITVRGIYAPGTTSAVTVKLQIAVSAGTGRFVEASGFTAAPVISWTLVKIK